MELRNRFGHNYIELMKAISSINPQSKNRSAYPIKPLTILYNSDYDCLCIEAVLGKKTLAKYELQNVHDVFVELLPLKSAYLNLFKYL